MIRSRQRWMILGFLMFLAVGIGGRGYVERAQAQTAPTIRELRIGTSAQGRAIEAVQIGDGPRKLVVIGNTHGGPEANTYNLLQELIAYFRANPQAVPPSVRLYLIPTLNPDGLALGWRFDSQGVDLNRNMNTNLDACPENDWSPTVQGARGIVSETGGAYPDSQAESRVIRSFLMDAAGAIFIHSNAGLVFPAFCDHAPSLQLGQVYAEGSGYIYSRFWPRYMITGGMHDWAGSLGIAAITPELVTGDQTEFNENLAGLKAVLARAEEILPLPQSRRIGDFSSNEIIWRYWLAHGGELMFGNSLQNYNEFFNGYSQTFTNGVIEVELARADSADLVKLKPLGRAAAAANIYGDKRAFATGDPNAGQFFPETGHTLKEAFLVFWQRNGGLEILGYPISEEFTGQAWDGQQRALQYFERAAVAYYPEDGSVRLEPLGQWYTHVELVLAPWAGQQVR